MSEQVDRLAKLATELLDLSRADAGRLRVERDSVDLDAVAETVVDEFAPRSNGRNLSFDGGEGAFVLGDEQRVLQIARVLVENALVHTPAGAHVEVRATAVRSRSPTTDRGSRPSTWRTCSTASTGWKASARSAAGSGSRSRASSRRRWAGRSRRSLRRGGRRSD